MVAIIQTENKILRQKAKEIPLADLRSKKIKELLLNMREALASQDDGVAIAAPQIGVALRIFVVSGKMLKRPGEKVVEDLVCINPTLTKLSKEKRAMEEGCLSVRWFYGFVRRATRATVTAYDENGKLFTRGASGLLAQIFQHETDHLDGILFIDKATGLHELPPPNKRKEAQI